MVFLAGILFFLSGAAALAYEVVWVKLLTLQFGSAAWSISTVVASFMAGPGVWGRLGPAVALTASAGP